jgi:hypothetical protein
MATSGAFSGISASWAATRAAGTGTTTSADATWIGIGGVSTNDLIQVGTQNIITPNGQVSTAAFYELLPNYSQSISSVTVTPGDTITASLVKISGNQWTISITDQTNGQSYTNSVSYASSQSSAEWIEEDPSFSTNRQIPFDNFGTASLADGATIINGSAVSIAGSQAQAITMLNKAGQTVATPSAIGSDGASFSITQSGAN